VAAVAAVVEDGEVSAVAVEDVTVAAAAAADVTVQADPAAETDSNTTSTAEKLGGYIKNETGSTLCGARWFFRRSAFD
jgi:hypothetical protein